MNGTSTSIVHLRKSQSVRAAHGKVRRCFATPSAVTFIAVSAIAASSVYASDKYHIEKRIPAQSIYWDYSSIDSDRAQLYVGRKGGVLAVDLKDNSVTENLFSGELFHAVTAIGEKYIVAADGPKNELKVYDASAKQIVATVKVGGHPDAIAFDRRTNTVVTVNKESRDLTLVDISTWKATATIKLSGDPEFAVSNDDGTLYVNIADKGEIDVVDLGTRRITGTRLLRGCREPSGIAYEKKFRLVVSVCGNGLAKFLTAPALREVASLAVGRGADAVLVDEVRSRVFIPAGDDGTLTVIAIRALNDIATVGALKTEAGAASGAVDGISGRVYLPAGRRLPADAEASGGWQPPTIAPGSFHILVIAPDFADPK